ncbi:MAG: TCP-1/cpn60 chaperonin family protein, partial [Planctomycetota bacterium]
ATARTPRDPDRPPLHPRPARPSGGVAQINVRAATESEMKEKKARVEDALHATRAAIEEGVLPGGGVALVRAEKALEEFTLEGDENLGVNIVRGVLSVPAALIAENAGYDGALTVRKIRSGEGAFGFNSATGETGDFFEMGIIDPTKVTRTALQNAVSVANMLISTEAIITDVPEKAEDDHHHHDHGMDDY